MSKSGLTISLNEVLFYFTRAGFGVKAPIGVSEDFARSNIWIAQNGFDPSECSLLALDNLDSQKSSLSIQFEKSSDGSRLFCPEDRILSAIEASVSCVDWLEFNGLNGGLKVTNVDCPLLVVSALGANQCIGIKVSWSDKSNNQYQVNLNDNTKWEIIASSDVPIEQSSYADIQISALDGTNKATIKNGKLKTFNIADERLKTLNNGVNVGDKWPEIYEYFSRCLVKSSAESRASGAGAGLVDTD
ncbi:MAG: hypothetical protein HOF63_05160 [Thiotrichales bacterium]|mgnify:FL=1|jgi:hypothetical protein|nr:hypothetical protein [Thiotrichales bacterium]MBT3854983.1 hypothetical protein [Thiotrichales bacterium]MBT4653060.1 hypothetical protein [Thiotrichales bacterium]MBT5499619.1 hypothetical protein [Thiotrichales bacterium]MBT5984579.1 hypothetical protein [Thiotrichales bacterium]